MILRLACWRGGFFNTYIQVFLLHREAFSFFGEKLVQRLALWQAYSIRQPIFVSLLLAVFVAMHAIRCCQLTNSAPTFAEHPIKGI